MITRRAGLFARRRAVKIGAVVALVLGPLGTVPVLLATAASAGTTPAPVVAACTADPSQLTYTLDPATGVATVTLDARGCSPQDVSLATYALPATAPTSFFPQARLGLTTVTLTHAAPTATLTATLPACYVQLDLILGSRAPKTLADAYFHNHGTLLTSGNAGKGVCTPVTTTSPPPSSSSSAPPTSSTAPPTTSSAPPTTTTPTSSLPVSVLPTVSATLTTGVLGVATTRSPSPSLSTAVLGESATLPSTGPNAPVRAALLLALALLSGGGALLLLLGREHRSTPRHH